MSETVSASVPINIRWTQELVDDGKGGSKFYMRLTPKITTGGRYMKGMSRNAILGVVDPSGHVIVRGLLSTIQRLKQEKSTVIKRAVKTGMETALSKKEYDSQRRQREAKEQARLQKMSEQSSQESTAFGMSNVWSSDALQKRFEEDVAAGRVKMTDVQTAKEEKEEIETEEIYYIK